MAKIFEGFCKHYEEYHKVTYAPDSMPAAAKLAGRYLQDRKLPDKAIDLIDEAGAAKRLALGNGATVDVADIEKIVAKMAQIPPRQVSADDKSQLKNLEELLKSSIYGQDDA